MQLEDKGQLFPAREIKLVPVKLPSRQATPRRLKTVAYSVYDWKQNHESCLASIPRQFAMMGFNVWSDYGFCVPGKDASPEKLTLAEELHAKVFREFGVKEFWPNHSTMCETGQAYSDLSKKFPEKDMYVVGADGKVDSSLYNMRYIAQGGKAWRDSSLAAYQYTLRRPRELKLPYGNSGYINDSLEGLLISYDPATLDNFARTQHVRRKEVTVANLQGKFKPQWLSYNMELYTRVARLWADAMREVDPNVMTINTLNSFGPSGSDSLPLREQMAWAKSFSYTMPQWYSLHYYGTLYRDTVLQGLKEKAYGSDQGGVDVIPLLHVSEGEHLQDAEDIRFKVFDLVSLSPAIKGIGYFVAAYGFGDGKVMAGLSRTHTLLADLEDYYVDGQRADALASFHPDKGKERTIPRLDLAGKATLIKMKTQSDVRVHKLNRQGRHALITVVTHHINYTVNVNNFGESGELVLNLKELAGNPEGKVLVDHLTGKVLPLTGSLRIDTHDTGGLRLLEILDRDVAEGQSTSRSES